MIKIIPPRSWDFDGPQLEAVKVSSVGLRGADFSNFVKRASHPQAMWVRNNPPKPGEVYVHSIALGAHEKVGQNRNADLYSDAMLERDHPTFVKLARFYRNHQNKDPKKSYGVCKHAHYDKDLGRVEVITALNGTKEAADNNGGLVAERTLEKMASGLDVAVSQSCKVSYDVCTSCGNKAKHRTEYCGPEMCKYGGCRDNLGRTFDDGFRLGVDNPHCQFFDLSDVSDTRGADRTAFITGKVAAAERIVGGAELADLLGLVPPEHLLDRSTQGALEALRKLASHKYPAVTTSPSWKASVEVRAKVANRSVNDAPDISTGDDYARLQKVSELASYGVILPPAEWLAAVSGAPVEKCAAVFADGVNVERDFLSRPDAHDLLCETPVFKQADSRISGSYYGWLAPTAVAQARETMLGVLAGKSEAVKAASVSVPAGVKAEAKARYLAYQGRALAANEKIRNDDLLLSECVRHNLGHSW